LLKDNLYNYLDIISLVTIEDIVDEKIVDKRIYLSIYIIEINKVILEARLYITKDIKVEIILDNNVLEVFQNKISPYLYNKQI
jgi:sucrose-6-phosphate hydrolase SacC (GH32 family)